MGPAPNMVYMSMSCHINNYYELGRVAAEKVNRRFTFIKKNL